VLAATFACAVLLAAPDPASAGGSDVDAAETDNPSEGDATGELSDGADAEQEGADPSDEAGAAGESGESSGETPAAGGFGTVNSVTTTSKVQAPPPPPEESEAEGPSQELTGRVEIGYGRADLGNPEGLDHHGLFLRGGLAFYPWVSKRKIFGVGVGLWGSYQGLNRKLEDADIAKSEAQQILVSLSFDMIIRAHQKWLSFQPTGRIGVGFYSGGEEVFFANEVARVDKNRRALGLGGSLAICTAWDIVCLVGGATYLRGLATIPADLDASPRRLELWTWNASVGLDVLRIYMRATRVDT
jgi:hypothetical protein